MENRNRKDKEKETLYAITGALVLLFGAITEIVIRQMQLSLSFCDCESVSLTLIQVEAVLFGLTISLIALLSGKIETSFLGINYADYVLNKKPQIYNQITIIGGLLIVLVLSILAHMLCWYIIVMSLFLCSSILIWLSASNIYLAFTGTIQLTEEIEIYFDACLLQGSEERIALLDSLQDDWAGKIARQTTSEYTVYLEKFFLLFRYMIKNDKELEQLTKTCVVLLKTMLKDDTLYESGLSFVDRCYEEAAAFIWRNKSELRKVNNSFHLFLEVFDGFRKAVSATPVRVLERLFQFDRLTENILITNLNLGNSNNNQNAASERYALSILGAVLGMRVSEDLEHNNEYWGRALTQQFSGLEKSEDWGGVGAETIAEQKYRFILAQIDRQYDVIINKFLFAESWKLEKMDTPHAMMMLKVFCYLYYLTFYEKDDCAPNELRTFCKKFCVSERAQKTFLKTILYLEEHDINISGFSPRIDVLNENFCQMMIDEMQQYEKYPGNGNGKLLIMEEAVKDFVAFLLSSIAQRYNMPELIDKMVTDDGASYYYMRYIRDDRHKQLEQFLSMTCLKEEQKESRVQDIYSVLEKQVRNLYKRSVIRRAETLEKPDNMDFSKIQKGIQRYLEEKFAPLLAEDSDTIVDANLLQLTIGSELRPRIMTSSWVRNMRLHQLISEPGKNIWIIWQNQNDPLVEVGSWR